MKDRIINFSSHLSTHSNIKKRLYVVTGKGGVGKTTIAMALTQKLKSIGKEVAYNSFDHEPNLALINQLDLPYVFHTTDQSARAYIANKLGSEMVASWIMKTPFFSSLLNMLPGLSHMILLGHLIKHLEENPNLTMVIDSPSSGHALTMFESSHNFKEMFGAGMIVDDIRRMHRFIYEEKNLKTIICSLPTKMAVQESLELKSYLQEINAGDIDLLLNDSIYLYLNQNNNNLDNIPEFLIKKTNQEKEAIRDGLENEVKVNLPHSVQKDKDEIIIELSNLMDEIIE